MEAVKLRDVVVRREFVELSTGQFVQVRGITTYDLMMMVGKNGPQIAMAFAVIAKKVKQRGNPVSNEDIFNLLGLVAQAAPDMAGNLIALVMDEYQDEEARRIGGQLPIADQLAILNAAALLTLSSEGTVKKLQASLAPTYQILSGMMKTLSETRTPLPNGTGSSART
jgi:hypothetical protein